VVDVHGEALGPAELDGEHLDAGQTALDRGGDLALKCLFGGVCVGHFAPFTRKGARGAPISPNR
jgi:hypothetical protein